MLEERAALRDRGECRADASRSHDEDLTDRKDADSARRAQAGIVRLCEQTRHRIDQLPAHWYKRPRIAQHSAFTFHPGCEPRPRPQSAPHRRARPGHHRGAAGERPRVVPADRRPARRLGGNDPRALRAARDDDILQVVAVTNPLGLGFEQALVGVRTTGPPQPVADEIATWPEADYVVVTAGQYDLVVEVVCRRPARAPRRHEPDARARRSRLDRDVPLPRAREAAVRLGHACPR